jgi:hypothetical protein
MRRLILCLILLLVVSTIPMAMADDDHDQGHRVRTHLSGFNEVHFIAGDPTVTPIVPPALRGAISTGASGKFVAEIDKHDEIIHYKLSYKNLEGLVTQAHIHFGQRHTTGGIVVWLCQTTRNPAPAAVAGLTPTCPEPDGTVEGTITPDQVLSVAGQGIAAKEFGELVRAIRAGVTYANVHSTLFTPGEIRGQIPGNDDD